MKSLIPLYMACFLVDDAIAILMVAVPIYACQLGASPMIIGLMGGVGGLAYTLSAVMVGRFSDKFDNRTLLLASALLQAVISFAYSLSTDNLSLILLGGLRSATMGVFWPSVENLLASRVEPIYLDKALTGFNISWSMGWIVGPFIGGLLLQLFSPQATFYTGAALSLITFLLIASSGSSKRVQVTKSREAPQTGVDAIAVLKDLATSYAAIFIIGFSQITIINLFPALTVFLNISPLETGTILLFIGLARTIAFTQSPVLARRVQKATLICLGSVLMTISAVIIARGLVSWHFALGMVFLGFGFGMIYFSALSTALGGEESSRGLRAGLFEAIIGSSSIIGPTLGGALSEIDMRLPYIVIAIATFFFLIYLLAQGWRRRKAGE